MTRTLMLLVGVAGLLAAADTVPLHTFAKQRLDDLFYAEGAAVADIDHDGKPDIIAGPFWWKGPAFTERTAWLEPKPVDPLSYSPLQFFTFAADIDGDGWTDLVTVGWPGKESFWWANPKEAGKPWTQHLILKSVDNETPHFTPVEADGKPVLVCCHDGRLGYARPDPADVRKPWSFRAVSGKGPWGRYAHGLGVGDVNRDGRLDLLLKEGWWEQPTDPTTTAWTHHQVKFGTGGAHMRVADIDGDGRNDVVTSLSAHEYGLSWFRQEADGTFTEQRILGAKPEQNPYGVCFSQQHALWVGDLDGDGLADLVTGKRRWAHGKDRDPEPNAPPVLYWFRQERTAGAVSFVPIRIDDDSGVGVDLVVADADGDGLKDIVISNKKGSFLFRHQVRQVTAEEWRATQPQPVAR